MGMYCTVSAVSPSAAAQLRANPDNAEPAFAGRAANSSVHLEKSWHGLHYLLTGSATAESGPLAFLLAGGDEIGEDDGYGPPRLFDPNAVRAIDAALATVTNDALWSRFDAGAMESEGVYPGTWDEDEADLREEYTTYFGELKGLIGRARNGGMGVVVSLS
jgi:hypothetical protein